MTFCRQNEQAASLEHLLLFFGCLGLDFGAKLCGLCIWVLGEGLLHFDLDVAAQLNIGSAASHVRGDGHRAQFARIGDDLSLLLVLTRIEDIVRDPRFGQQVTEEFRFIN